jgi:hypothetical protein
VNTCCRCGAPLVDYVCQSCAHPQCPSCPPCVARPSYDELSAQIAALTQERERLLEDLGY